MYVKKGRVIVKEGHEPSCAYFILYGEMNISKKFINQVTDKEEEVIIGKMEMGDMFGEAAIMGNTVRLATISADSK